MSTLKFITIKCSIPELLDRKKSIKDALRKLIRTLDFSNVQEVIIKKQETKFIAKCLSEDKHVKYITDLNLEVSNVSK